MCAHTCAQLGGWQVFMGVSEGWCPDVRVPVGMQVHRVTLCSSVWSVCMCVGVHTHGLPHKHVCNMACLLGFTGGSVKPCESVSVFGV